MLDVFNLQLRLPLAGHQCFPLALDGVNEIAEILQPCQVEFRRQ